MTTGEIFSKIAVHMIEGLMFHQQMANYYEFLGLEGYAQCHGYRYMEESCNFHMINQFYVGYYNKLLPELRANDPAVIPDSWYKYERNDVDTSTKRGAVKTGLEKWVKWETDTLKLYEDMFKELLDMKECAAALRVAELIDDVKKELEDAIIYHLDKKATDYEISNIIEDQKSEKKKYKWKLK